MSEAIEKALAKFKAALDAFRNSKKTPEQIEKAKELYDSLDPGDRSLLEYIFPEVVETDDERIMNEMIAYFAHKADVTEFIDEGEDCKRWIAYLEKRKEHFTPEEKMNHPLFLEGFDVGRQVGEVIAKPAEWSEEDEAVLDALIRRLEGEDIYVSPHLAAECLKSLRSRPKSSDNWKPSEEQMEELGKAKDMYMKSSSGIASLYYDLKTKLM